MGRTMTGSGVLLAACFLLTAGCSREPAQTNAPGNAADTPKEAFVTTINAIHDGDPKAILDVFYAAGKDRNVLEGIAESFAARHEFDAAFAKRFGKEEADVNGLQFPSADAFKEMLDNAPVRIEGNKAFIGEEVRFVRSDGRWKMMIADMVGMMQCGHIKNIDVVMQRSAKEMRACMGEIDKPGARPEEVRRKLGEALDRAGAVAELKEEYTQTKRADE